MARRPHFLEPLLKQGDTACTLRIAGRDVALATTVEAAFDSASRNRGLLGRNGLPAGTALVIAPSNAVHTFGMRFAIDVVFAARDGRVVKVRTGVRPRRIAVAWRGFAVIELAAGEARRTGVRPGDRLELAARS